LGVGSGAVAYAIHNVDKDPALRHEAMTFMQQRGKFVSLLIKLGADVNGVCCGETFIQGIENWARVYPNRSEIEKQTDQEIIAILRAAGAK
jgi:hypothetical protein